MTGTQPSISGADEFWCLCVYMCVRVCEHSRDVLSILFLTSFLMMLAFVTATILWTAFLREWATMMPSSFSWITSALGGLGLRRTRWVLFSCGHYVQLPVLSVSVLCPLTQLCEIFPVFILVRLVFQLPENLGIIYKFEISLYWCLRCFWKMINGPPTDSWNTQFLIYPQTEEWLAL